MSPFTKTTKLFFICLLTIATTYAMKRKLPEDTENQIIKKTSSLKNLIEKQQSKNNNSEGNNINKNNATLNTQEPNLLKQIIQNNNTSGSNNQIETICGTEMVFDIHN